MSKWHRNAAPHRRLRRGHRGADVKRFQLALAARLEHIPGGRALKPPTDGVFDNRTLRAWRVVRVFLGLPLGHAPTVRAQLNTRRPWTRSRRAKRLAKQRRRNAQPIGAPKIVTAAELGMTFAYVWGAKGPVTRFGLHYSAGAKATSPADTVAKARAFHAGHVANGWGGGSYEYVVGPGVIVCLNPTNRKSAAVAGQNTGMAGVCVPGTTGDRLTALEKATLRYLRDNAHTTRFPARHRMPRPIRQLDCRPHRYFPGQATACPGDYTRDYQELFT